MKSATTTFLLLLTFCLFAQRERLPADHGEIILTPILHATMVLEWNDQTLYIDPYGGAERFADFTSPDIVVITHKHGDHFNKETLEKLDLANAELIAPQSVVDEIGNLRFGRVTALRNGEDKSVNGVSITAIPMYNLPETDESRHPKGWGNGYVITLGGKRIYISGDTEDIKEMRELKNIDYAFICMNQPYTMEVEQAASAVLAFKPKVVYPFHFRGKGGVFSDVQAFKRIINAEDAAIEVRIRDWYPEK